MINQTAPFAIVRRHPGRRCAFLAGMLASVLIAAGCGTGNEFGAQPRFTADGGIESGVDPLSRGKRHFANGNFGLAIEAFEEARQIAPGSINVLNALAVAYEEIGRPDLADSYFLEALDVEPDSAQTYNNWAMAQLSRGNGAKAQELLAEAARLSPDDDVVIANMARVAAATTLLAADQAAVPIPPAGSLGAIIAELQQSDSGWEPSIRSVAPHVHVLQTLPPGATATAAPNDALPVVLYPQSAAADILPMPDGTDMPTPPPAVPVIPVFAAMLGTPGASTGDASVGSVRPMLAGRLASAVPVGLRYPDGDGPSEPQTSPAEAAPEAATEPPHFQTQTAVSDVSDSHAQADPILIRPFQDMPQDVELATMMFRPIGPEADVSDSNAVRVLTSARNIEIEPAVASRPEPMAIGVWSTIPVAASETMPEPLRVWPASAESPARTGTVVVPYEGQSAAAATESTAGLTEIIVVRFEPQTAAVPDVEPAADSRPVVAPAAKPDPVAAPDPIAVNALPPPASKPELAVPDAPAPVEPPANEAATTEPGAGPGVTALAAVPPLVTIADAIRIAVSPAPAAEVPPTYPAAADRMPLIVAVLAASEAMALPSPGADTLSVQSSRPPLAAAGRIPTVVATIAMRKTDGTDDGHEDEIETVQ